MFCTNWLILDCMFCTNWLILGYVFARAIIRSLSTSRRFHCLVLIKTRAESLSHISRLKKKELVFVKQERQVPN
ncbi:unnamed protein product [Acanthoscelides obtectus]|uniref:Uncharacterized protein n=1 Tax=Acanthoscelides obtectus TaxID=200917 RepID=A0A9P0LUB0_ACAOB|nr:unnamed protein product [Acanthoscelides obtectus]CAK1686582.1 hypothetical protein AOBTE_LOCUS36001 [Acanthoscelides obtectus]